MKIRGKTKRSLQTSQHKQTPVFKLPKPEPTQINGSATHELNGTVFPIAKPQRFSQSLLWELQRDYFTHRGVDAWRRGEVPHYITSNPTVANSYAEMVLACRQDQSRLITSEQPLYLCELGAGSGRFAFHFLSRLSHLCRQTRIPLTNFRYILTDFTPGNLRHWSQHPRFQAWFEQGVLDIALFDINHSDQLNLQFSGHTISTQTLQRPLVVIANYLFDSIPQDLYYIDNHRIQDCLVSLYSARDPRLNDVQRLEDLSLRYHYQSAGSVEASTLEPLLTHYQHTLTDTHLLFPTTGLLCLQRLQALSQQGLLLLSADKGNADLAGLRGNAPPQLVNHGSFSLSVNYPIFQTFCEQNGGIALVPEVNHHSIYVVCLLMCEQASRYAATRQAYQRQVQTFGPDDFYSITKHARKTLDHMDVEEILAYLRLSYYDSHQFARYLPRLMELAPGVSAREKTLIIAAVDRVWQLYFHIGENGNLANEMARLCHALKDDTRPLSYFRHSLDTNSQHPNAKKHSIPTRRI